MIPKLMSVIGSATVAYLSSYLILLLFSDCDIRLLFSCLFGVGRRQRLRNYYTGKVVWITGASSGIGEYIALALSSHGAKLVLTARNEVELQRVKNLCMENINADSTRSDCRSSDLNISNSEQDRLTNTNARSYSSVTVTATTDDILVLPMDVTDISKHQLAFDKVIQHFGKLDILINNAGRSQRATWENIELSVDREMFDLNVFSNISLSRIAVKYFSTLAPTPTSTGGQIVVTSSLAGVTSVPYSPTYCATKYALHGYYESLLKEKIGGNIKVTMLCPGPVCSNLLPACFTEKSGENFGKVHTNKEARMQTERCAHLSLIAIAANLKEAWMANPPILLFVYFSVYCPVIAGWMHRFIGPKILQKLRDQAVTVVPSQ